MRSCLLTIMKVCTRSQLERITGSGRIQKKKHAGPKCALVRARKSHPAGPQQHTTYFPFFSLILRNNSLHFSFPLCSSAYPRPLKPALSFPFALLLHYGGVESLTTPYAEGQKPSARWGRKWCVPSSCPRAIRTIPWCP